MHETLRKPFRGKGTFRFTENRWSYSPSLPSLRIVLFRDHLSHLNFLPLSIDGFIELYALAQLLGIGEMHVSL